ncbi:MAG: 5'/3'-nucleotidase SurE [Pseudomonadota bacterium]
MKVLISNDDGYRAPGIRALRDAIAPLVEQTVIVAPDRNRSGASNSLTLEQPVRVWKDAQDVYFTNGTPTDCVHLAVTGGLFDFEPDMVISGINHGPNLGDDVLYSGTVAAAMEGRFLGLPALAMSLASPRSRFMSAGAHVAAELVRRLMADPLPADTILNVNVPAVAVEDLGGYRSTRLGHRHKAEPAIPSTDPRGARIYWVGPAGEEQDAGEGTDFHALTEGCVSITPLQVDLTRHSALPSLAGWVSELGA